MNDCSQKGNRKKIELVARPDQESVATYFRYLIHFLLLTQEVKVFFGWYSAGKSTAYVHPSLPKDLPSWFVSRYHIDSQDQAMEGNFK